MVLEVEKQRVDCTAKQRGNKIQPKESVILTLPIIQLNKNVTFTLTKLKAGIGS